MLAAGTVTDFDAQVGVGLIEADDGDLVLFNAGNLKLCDAGLLSVGTRVRFAAHEDVYGCHADAVLPA